MNATDDTMKVLGEIKDLLVTKNETITKQADQIKMLRDALGGVTNMWCELVKSGDAGRWDPETDKPVIAARKALAATEAK